MKCRMCNVEKLSREFPREPLTEQCNHPALYCLRCVTKEVKSKWICPYDGCRVKIEADNACLKECEETLEFLFPEVSPPEDLDQPTDHEQSHSLPRLQVTTLTGEVKSFSFHDKKTVRELKNEIAYKMAVAPDKQRLVYNGTEVKATKADGTANLLSDFGVKAHSTIHLMVLLHAVPEGLNHMIFDLSWTYPNHGRDILDASCLLFTKDVWYTFVDWREKSTGWSVWHSGDKMDDQKRTGRHRIEAKLKEIPLCVSHLVFVLSSFKSPTIAAFHNPTLRCYDATNDQTELCSASFENANAQALIVCCVSRTKDNTWIIEKGGQTSAGSAKNYHPLVKTIKQMISKNLFTGIALAPGKSLIRDLTPQEQREFEKKCIMRLQPGSVY